MTINEYFIKKNQPVSTELVNGIYYKDIQTITFGDENRYAQIKIAHVEANTWAFGWEIKDGAHKPIISHNCTPNITTQGNIRKLVYGMTKVLQRQIMNMHYPTNIILDIISDAIQEASYYYRAGKSL